MKLFESIASIGICIRRMMVGPSLGDGASTAQRVSQLVALGDAANLERNWPLAERCYRDVLALEQSLGAIWVQLGHATKEQGRFAEAQSHYEQAIKLMPRDGDSRLQLGHCLKLQGKWREARQAFEQALDLNPELAAARYELRAVFGVDHTAKADVTADTLFVGDAADPQYHLCKNDFDFGFYLDSYPDVRVSNCDPLLHYLRLGWREGRNPAPWFDTQYYLKMNEDVAQQGLNPFVHFLLAGKSEGRKSQVGPRGLDLAHDIWGSHQVIALPCRTSSDEQVKLSWAPRVCVHIHCYYLSVMPEIVDALRNVCVPFSVLLTSDSASKLNAALSMLDVLEFCISTEAVLVPNRGRDVAPFLIEFGKRAGNFDVVLHLHTKVSKEKPDVGRAWLRHALRGLLYDRTYVASLLNLIRADDAAGLLTHSIPLEVEPFVSWGDNKGLAKEVAERIGIEWSVDMERLPFFPVGFMFWCRADFMRRFFEASYAYEDFPVEPIPADGTLAHAIERCVGFGGTARIYEIGPLPAHKLKRQEKKKVSVIVPSKNAGCFYHDCIQSVLQQDNLSPGFQLLLVDNGSDDNTETIAKFYASNYPNIKFFQERAEGAGAARNLGLEMSGTDYVMFLDADDLLSRSAIRELVYVIERDGADVVTSPLRIFSHSNVSGPLPWNYSQYRALPISLKSADDEPSADTAQYLEALLSDFGSCAKLYRASLLKSADIRFPVATNYEDNFFVYRVYLEAGKITNSNYCSYYYRKGWVHPLITQSTRVCQKACVDFLLVTQSVIDLVNERDLSAERRRVVHQALHSRVRQMERHFEEVIGSDPRAASLLGRVYLSLGNACVDRGAGE